MIEFSYGAKDDTVFIHCSTNAEEKIRIETLLGQIKTICKIIRPEGKTGLRIVRELNYNGSLCVVLSLNKVISLGDEELRLILEEVQQRQGH